MHILLRSECEVVVSFTEQLNGLLLTRQLGDRKTSKPNYNSLGWLNKAARNGSMQVMKALAVSRRGKHP